MSAYAMFCRGDPTHGSLGTASYAFAQKNIGSHDDELWLTTRVAFDSRLPSGTETAYFHALATSGTYLAESPIPLEGVLRDSVSRWASHAHGVSLHAATPAIASWKWFLFESHVERNVDRGSIITCDGNWASSSVHDLACTFVVAGCWAPLTGFFQEGLRDPFECYVDYCAVGTTRRGTDIFEDDFASGDFSAWSAHTHWTGTEGVWDSSSRGATILDRPSLPFVSESCMGEQREGVYLAPITIPYGNVPVGPVG